jgi:hypothetical protein
VRIISWLLPVTYGIQLFQGIMLRGTAPTFMLTGGLLVIAVVTFVMAWLLTWRIMRHR